MSSVKQEVAAILMDYTDKIPEQIYMEILNKLGQIPDHKDPKKAVEIQKELDETKENLSMLEDEREILTEEIQNEIELREEWQSAGRSLAFLCEKIFNKKATFDGSKVIYDVGNMDEVDRNINKVNGFLNNLEDWKKGQETEINESFIYSENATEDPLPQYILEEFRDLLEVRRNSFNASGDEEDSELDNSDIESYEELEKDEDNFRDIPEIDDSYFQENEEETICGFGLSYLIGEINTIFSGKVHNYYGAILLHEDNCWTNQLESINNFKIHHTRKKQMREMKFQAFQKKKSQWHHSNFNAADNAINAFTLEY
tara:strand:+ start:3805 stop:4746 length:942 start_codon:yes stop_codon:yes gene_type:complete